MSTFRRLFHSSGESPSKQSGFETPTKKRVGPLKSAIKTSNTDAGDNMLIKSSSQGLSVHYEEPYAKT